VSTNLGVGRARERPSDNRRNSGRPDYPVCLGGVTLAEGVAGRATPAGLPATPRARHRGERWTTGHPVVDHGVRPFSRRGRNVRMQQRARPGLRFEAARPWPAGRCGSPDSRSRPNLPSGVRPRTAHFWRRRSKGGGMIGPPPGRRGRRSTSATTSRRHAAKSGVAKAGSLKVKGAVRMDERERRSA